MAHKIEVPDDLNTPYAPPADATLDQLREIEKSANDTALSLLDGDSPSDEAIAKAYWLRDAMVAVQGAASTLETAEQEKKNLIDELKGGFNPSDPQADADVAGQVDAPLVAEQEPAAVLAAALPSVGAIAAAQARPTVAALVQSRRPVTLTAAADVPGFSNGEKLNADRLGDAFEARAKGYKSLLGKPGRVQNGFATVHIPMDEALLADGQNPASIKKALERALDEKQLPGESLLAAGGWCAPSEVLYDVPDFTSADGLLSVPEIGVTRGGIKWTTGPNFGAVYAQGMASLTESQVQGGSTKTSYDVPCPAFQEQRLNADYLFLTADILSERGYPEMISDFITKAQKAFQHFESGKTIADIATGSTAVDMSSWTDSNFWGATPNILGAAELQAEDMKYRSRLARGTTVELVLPFYTRGIIRSDIAKREGVRLDELQVTDAQIDQMFSDRGIAVQYVYDWQENIVTGGTGNPFGAAAASGAALTWPQKLKGLMYPAGTWFRAIVPVIELSTLYDSTLLAGNQYVGLFQEQGRSTFNRGFDSRQVTFQTNPSGLTSGFVAQTNPVATNV